MGAPGGLELVLDGCKRAYESCVWPGFRLLDVMFTCEHVQLLASVNRYVSHC